jgi:hypothetical protein
MRHPFSRFGAIVVIAALAFHSANHAAAVEVRHGWDGKRNISYQDQKDLFYNYYAQPGPCYGATAAGIYPSPGPIPPRVGWTWVTYQPYMPHEYMYAHQRSYYTYNQGAGWTRTNVRYGTAGLRHSNWAADLNYPRSLSIWPLHTDTFYPGLRF